MKALGIDHGAARIGLALSDDLGLMAHPLETLATKDHPDPIEPIAAVVMRHRVETVVVGLPRNMDGTYGPAAEKVRAFSAALRAKVPCPVQLWDERLTSVAAQRLLHTAGRDTRESRRVIDQVAAQLILQGWLDAQAPPPEADGEL